MEDNFSGGIFSRMSLMTNLTLTLTDPDDAEKLSWWKRKLDFNENIIF